MLIIHKVMVKTRWTQLVSVRIELDLLKRMKEDVRKKIESGDRHATLSSVINRMIQDYYYKE